MVVESKKSRENALIAAGFDLLSKTPARNKKKPGLLFTQFAIGTAFALFGQLVLGPLERLKTSEICLARKIISLINKLAIS